MRGGVSRIVCAVFAMWVMAGPANATHIKPAGNSYHSRHSFSMGIDYPVGSEAWVGNYNRKYPFVDDFCDYNSSKNRPNSQCFNGNGHQGNDVYAYTTQVDRFRVLAPEAGRVEDRGCQSGAGRLLWLQNTPSGAQYKFFHLAAEYMSTGQIVAQGQVLGTIGNTQKPSGSSCVGSTTPHLHFEMYQGAVTSSANLRCPYPSLTWGFSRPGEDAHRDSFRPAFVDAFYNAGRGGGREVSGWPIRSQYTGANWVAGWGSGLVQEFNWGSRGHSAIMGHGSTGTYIMYGAIRAKYDRLRRWYPGLPDQTLGWLLADEQGAAPSPTGHIGRYSPFQLGEIVFDGATGRAWEVHGAIRQRYDAIGGSGSVAGFPVSDEHRHYIPSLGYSTYYSAFERGCITWQNGGWNYSAYGSSACGAAHAHGEGPNG